MAEVKKEKENVFVRMWKWLVNWFKNTKAEFKKIIWPTPKKILKDTGIVIVSVIILGAFISLVQYLFHQGLTLLLNV